MRDRGGAVSLYKEAQDWLTIHRIYPGPGLANAIWAPDRQHLAVVTRRWQVLLYRVEPPDVLWVTEPDPVFSGMEFLGPQTLVVRRHARPADSAVGGRARVRVDVERQEIELRWIAVDEDCHTVGHSLVGRFQLLRRTGGRGREYVGMIDLRPWDEGDPGDHAVDVVPHTLPASFSTLRFAQISPDGTRLIARTGRKDSSKDHFLDLRAPEAPVSMPSYPWARPRYLWSPDGRWLGAVIQEITPEDWDEIPVGGPDLRSFVALYDGRSGERVWLEEVDTVHAPFEWTADGAFEAGHEVWHPESGGRLPG